MDVSQLTEIVSATNKEQIKNRLKTLGYTCCNKDRKLGKVGIVELVNAVKFETEDFTDADRKHLYNGRICRTVKGYENYEFVYINIFEIKPSTDPFDDEETAIQTEMLIWAKEV